MCGITGAVSLCGAVLEKNRIVRMTDKIFHRGPESGGVWYSPEGDVCFGHRRLAIIDVSDSASQPMMVDNGAYSIVFNGEVFNFKELRAELEKKGYRFGSSSDTEVVLRAYQEYGDCCVKRFNGMWGLAIYDRHRKKVFLSRDRLGIKPVYIYRNQSTLLFASEIKAILASGLYSPEVDLEGLNEYFSFQNIISARTLFRNISMLPPGRNISNRVTLFSCGNLNMVS